MSFIRILIAFVVAASVAMLPVVGAAAPIAKSMDMSVSMHMSASDDMSISQGMSECCPPKAAPCDKAMDNCTYLAACAFNFLSFSNVAFSDLVFPLIGAQVLPSPARQTLRAQTSNPPFRPPRV